MMWMIYGAYGYSGALIAREAVRRGHRPLLAGRDAAKTAALAAELGLEHRVFEVDRPELSGVTLVLHAAGPFIHTSAPMVQACLDARVHYLDITGEIAVFEAIFRRDAEARERGVLLLPGVGFDVVPTDCLAAALHARMPDATELWLAFSAGGGVSRGTLKTMIEGAGRGSAVRRDGRLAPVPQAWDVREIPFPSGARLAMTIPWGDLSTAWRTTGIPNIRVYASQSRGGVKRIRRMRPFLPLLRIPLLRRLALRWADRHRGPSEEQRARRRAELWGRVTNARGEEVTMTNSVADVYTFTALAAVSAVERVLASASLSGATTPSLAFGAGFVDEV